VGNDAMFARLCETIDAPDLPKDPRFRDNGARTTNQAALREAMESRLSVRTRDEWIPLLRASRVPCAPLNDVADVMAEPQVHHRDMLVSLPVPGGRSLTIAGCPVKFADGGDRPTYTAAPMLDEHGAAIRAEIAAAKGLRETETAKIHQDT
jgi:CoA:oxalate CoA-transferase